MNNFHNLYTIPRKRYAILKRLCESYPEMKYDYNHLDFYGKDAGVKQFRSDSRKVSDPTYQKAVRRIELSRKIDVIERSARQASPEYANYILLFVTEDHTFEELKYELKLDCPRQDFFQLKEKFFWILNRAFFPAEAAKLNKIDKIAA